MTCPHCGSTNTHSATHASTCRDCGATWRRRLALADLLADEARGYAAAIAHARRVQACGEPHAATPQERAS